MDRWTCRHTSSMLLPLTMLAVGYWTGLCIGLHWESPRQPTQVLPTPAEGSYLIDPDVACPREKEGRRK